MRNPCKSNRRWLLFPMLWVSVLTALGVLVLFTGALRDPTRSLHGVIGSMVWTTFGPHLVLLSLFALIPGIIGFRTNRGRLSGLALRLSMLAVLGSTAITVHIVSSVTAAGGTVNLVESLFLKSMDAGGPDEVVVFRSFKDQDLYVAVYTPAEYRPAAPVLVYIHGGGFMTGSNIETDADLRWFSEQGWLVFSVDYRLFTPEIPTWDKAPEDIACALAWVGANAERYQGDLSRTALLGDSAGGNLALNFAYAAARGTVQSDCGPVILPAAVVVQYPAVDPVAIYEYGYPIPGFEPKMLVSGYIGGAPDDFPDRIHAVSSATKISNQAPPTLILAPEKDSIVPFRSVYRFAEDARSAGVEIEFLPIPFANHVYNQMAASSIGNQARRTLTRRYLLERGLGPDRSHP